MGKSFFPRDEIVGAKGILVSFFCVSLQTMVLHIEDIKALAHRAQADERFCDGLFVTMHGDDWREARNAAWALTHLPASCNGRIDDRRDELTALAIATPDTSLRRLTLALLERLEWGRDDVRTDLLDFCLTHMALRDEPYGVQALCMKLAYAQCRHYPELKGELRAALLLMPPAELGAGVKHTRGKILKML